MYNDFSLVYDKLIDTDYNRFVHYYKQIFEKYSISPMLIADIGCGTGTLTSLMRRQGYDMIGIDISTQMLNSARQKDSEILFLNQSLCDFELYGTVDVIYSSLDCINYILDTQELHRFFSLAHNYLNTDGLLIFDISTHYKLSKVLGNETFVFDDEDIFYVWENSFNDNILDMCLTIFCKDGGSYKRIDEAQTQRAYTVQEILSAAEKAGFCSADVFDEFSFSPPCETSRRVFFVIRKA